MRDSGGQIFLKGTLYQRQIDALTMTVCVAKEIGEAEWDEYVIAGTQSAKKLGAAATVSMAMFTAVIPSPVQRKRLAAHLRAQGVPPLLRVGVLTDSALVRGALTAFSWLMPGTTMRAFATADVNACLTWLRAGGDFDAMKAAASWAEGRRTVGLDK